MKAMFKQLKTFLFTGIIVLAPTVVSVWVIMQLVFWIDNIIPKFFKVDFPFGIGLMIILSFSILIGMVAKNYVGKKLIEAVNALIVSVPILNKVFLIVQQIMDVATRPSKNFLGQVVVVEYPKEDSWCLGFVTSRDAPEISNALGEMMICVYVPTTPNPTSGFMLYVPEHKVRDVGINTDFAIKAIVSAGMVSSAKTSAGNNSDLNFAKFLKNWKNSKIRAKSVVNDPRD